MRLLGTGWNMNSGYLFEQEWAFGWGFTRLVSWVAKGSLLLGLADSPPLEIISALAVTSVSHLFSVLVLYRLSGFIFPQWQYAGRRMSFLTASLHVISPAGLFLIAPYAEGLFSFLSFSAFCLYAEARMAYQLGRISKGDLMTLASGAMFGLATTVRSNGLLGGLLFLYDAMVTLRALAGSSAFLALRRLTLLILGGSCIAWGAFLPQYIAYIEYCIRKAPAFSPRPWCQSRIPSIYTWVQDNYWQAFHRPLRCIVPI
ncbi:MAG: ER membrane glycoprotein subunit of the GPI transamidase complex-like protein [Pleopsidium flavum]|nr:MAG: ER membrane glycoprotein subunit of the GPI transamidase complex-like protein [Pleopsidium flavum]